MKIAIIFFMLGIVQGAILRDWHQDKQLLRLATAPKKRK
jgi:hypothetical protein